MLAAAASEALLGDAQAALNIAKSQLQAARRYLTRAVDADPQYDAAQLHLGRVCHLLGDDEAASNALASVLPRTNDPNIRYVAELVAGSIHEAAGRLDAARESFERAAALQPRAQAPLVALSHVAREAGHRAEAVRYIERLAALPLPTEGRDDPWWHYESAAVADHAALLSTLRATLRAGRVP
jgi:tetratricopeptide (TPR) repeat protein